MLKIRLYHIRTLFWTYLVWAVLMLLFAFLLCRATNYPLTWMPYSWALLHIIPLLVLIETLWYGEQDPFIIFAAVSVVVAGFAIVAGILIKGRWARFLIIIGMSIWFLCAFCTLAPGCVEVLGAVHELEQKAFEKSP